MSALPLADRWFRRPSPSTSSGSFSATAFCLSVALGVGLSSCVSRPDKAYFTKDRSWDIARRIACPANNLSQKQVRAILKTSDHIDWPCQCPRDPDTKLMVTEFNDQGEPRVPQQLNDAVKAIRDFDPDNVLVYVHGWRNDSSPDCGETPGKDMNDLDGMLHSMTKVGKGRTLAIYVGWRGEIWNHWQLFSLNNRRNVAGQIGHRSELITFLGNVAAAGKRNKSIVIFTGHSLGAALLEKAAAKMIAPLPEGTLPDENRLPHLFLLANSAELADTSQVQIKAINNSALAQQKAKGKKLLAPLVMAVTSIKDCADLAGNTFHSVLNNKLQATLGFDPRLLTHSSKDAEVLSRSTTPDNMDADIMRLARDVRLDPCFWVPNAEHTKLTLYRMMPRPLAVRKSPVCAPYRNFFRIFSPGSYNDFSPSDTNNEIFWNTKIPRELSGGHNDVYNVPMVAAAMSLLRIAHPEMGGDSRPPDDLPELLGSLKQSIRDSSSGPDPMMRELVMGAATRMPRNATCISLLMEEVGKTAAAARLDEAQLSRYRINLFYILKFTTPQEMKAGKAGKGNDPVKSQEEKLAENDARFGWTAENIKALTALMEKPEIRLALKRAGNASDDSAPETDKNLNAFYAFLRQHDISPP